MRYTLLLLALITMPLFSQPQTLEWNGSTCDLLSSHPDLTPNTNPYQLVWHDEFDEGQISEDYVSRSKLRLKTIIGTKGHVGVNNSWQSYNHAVGNGFLMQRYQYDPKTPPQEGTNVVFSWPEEFKATEFSASNLETTFPDGYGYSYGNYPEHPFFKYGKISARIKTPFGKGLFHAFWLWAASPLDETTPGISYELDVLEEKATNGFENIFMALRSSATLYRANVLQGDVEFTRSLHSNFHIYTVEWDEHGIIFSIDGNEKYYVPRYIRYSGLPGGINMVRKGDPIYFAEYYYEVRAYTQIRMAIILEGKVCADDYLGGRPVLSHLPAYMYTDWVRVWQRTPQYPEWTNISLQTQAYCDISANPGFIKNLTMSLSEFPLTDLTVTVNYKYIDEYGNTKTDTKSITFPAGKAHRVLALAGVRATEFISVTCSGGGRDFKVRWIDGEYPKIHSAPPLAVSNIFLKEGGNNSITSNSVTIKWDHMTTATNYRVYYSTELPVYNSPSTQSIKIGLMSNESFPEYTITGLLPNTAYHFGVLAENHLGFSPQTSNHLSITTHPLIFTPPTPTGLTTTEVYLNKVYASWDTTPNTDGYRVRYSVNGGQYFEINNFNNTTWTSFLQFNYGDTICVMVASYNEHGTSNWSIFKCVTIGDLPQ